MFERTVLLDGPRVITSRLAGARSVSLAAYVLAGSRLESPEEAGAAHFMEHITFKGTAAYPTTRAVSEAIEGIGGSFNAATDRESTVYWVRVPLREAVRGMDVLGELIVRPHLRGEEIESERAVIVEEIRSYLDDPGEHVHTLFDLAMFGDTPLGREIAGSEESVRALTRENLRAFWASAYRPGNVVVSAAGDISHEEVVALAERAFGTGAAFRPVFDPAPPLPAGDRIVVARRHTTQAQLCLGVPGLPRDDPGAWTLEILSAILGDGMSSRLFQSVREEKGLAYDVSSYIVDYADAGALVVSAGVDPARIGPAVKAILAELARLRDEPVPADELARSKAYLGGRMELRMEETRHLASWLGGQEALHDRVLTLEQALAELGAVTSDGILEMAGRLVRDDLLRLAAVTPRGRRRGLEAMLRLPGGTG
ncbi:MAG: pitrilysin family protein [Candidatus Limnocylindrales bacterium]|jgi:predicted Zn-dependent peptidase